VNRIMITLFLALSSALSGALWTAASSAQAFPQKMIKMVVATTPGSPPDVMARTISQKLSDGLGQTVFVENRPGAGGTIGAGAVAKAAPDGYTLLLGSASSLSIAPSLYPGVTYDSVNSFAPISIIGTTTYVMVVHPAVPARSLKELIVLAKSKPGQLNYGTTPSGTPPHLVLEMFKKAAGVDIFGINYSGSPAAFTALLAGDVQVLVDQFAPLLPLIASGKMRPLVVTSDKRARQLPDVPSASEAGLPGFEADGWFGLLAPKGTPNDIVKRLHGEVVKTISSRELIEALERQGVDAAHSTPEEFQERLRTDAIKWASAVKMSGAKVQ
jgi:tripartite-type tricarboxylate transporter receptor subunit TctC